MSLKSVKLSASQGTISNSRLSNQSIVAGDNYLIDNETWSRPSGWLDLPNISGGPQKFVGLCRVDPTGNFLALQCSTNTGSYLIDWGDNSSEYVAGATSAYHEYNYNSISNSGESSLGYRQVIVTITPSGTNNITALNLNINHNRTSLNTNRPHKWLDIAVNLSGCVSLSLGGNNSQKRYCERVRIFDHNITTAGQMCLNMFSLASFEMAKTSQITSWNNAFNGTAFVTAPNLDLSNATNLYQMFLSCARLRHVPLYNTAKVTSFESMFQSCPRIETVPLFDTSSATTMLGMFNGCTSLIDVPFFNTSKVTTMVNMFNGCSLLKTVPCFDTKNVTLMQTMFGNCINLESLPSFDMSNNTSLNQFVFSCTKLRKIPWFNTSKVTSWNNAFNGTTIEELPPLDTSNAISFQNTLGSTRIRKFPTLDVTKATDLGGFCYDMKLLESVPSWFNPSGTTNASNMFFNCYRLISIPSGLDISKTTNTSAMFWGCINIKTIPPIDTSKSTNAASMFRACTNLVTIPYIETSGVTDASNMFIGDINLVSLPNLNLSNNTTLASFANSCTLLTSLSGINFGNKVTNMDNAFNGCYNLLSIPHIVATGVTNASNVFLNCANLSSGSLSGITITHSIANCHFSADALNTYYTNLGNGTGRTLTVTGNYGVTEDNPSIATAKGWTVTG